LLRELRVEHEQDFVGCHVPEPPSLGLKRPRRLAPFGNVTARWRGRKRRGGLHRGPRRPRPRGPPSPAGSPGASAPPPPRPAPRRRRRRAGGRPGGGGGGGGGEPPCRGGRGGGGGPGGAGGEPACPR